MNNHQGDGHRGPQAAHLHQFDGRLRRGPRRAIRKCSRSLPRFSGCDRGICLDYTILRPGWFTHDEAVAYQLTQTGEPFKGHDVSLNSLSDLVVKLARTPGIEIRHSLGVSQS